MQTEKSCPSRGVGLFEMGRSYQRLRAAGGVQGDMCVIV